MHINTKTIIKLLSPLFFIYIIYFVAKNYNIKFINKILSPIQNYNNKKTNLTIKYSNKLTGVERMRAAVINQYGGSDKLEIVDLPIPNVIDKQALIKIFATGINPIDYKIRSGFLRYVMRLKFPVILGYDICGEIVGLGRGADGFSLGDFVVAYSNYPEGRGYAEYIALDAKHLVKKPKNLTVIVAAGVPLASLTALQALRNYGNIQPDHEVMIIGATGGVGLFAIQLAKNLGAKVTAVCSTSGVNLIKNFNIDNIIDYKTSELFVDHKKYSIIFDTVGKYDFNKLKEHLNKNGKYISTLSSRSTWFSFITNLFTNKKCYAIRVQPNMLDLQYVIQQLEQGKLKVIVDKVYPLSKVIDAHEYSETGHAHGKIILSIDDEL